MNKVYSIDTALPLPKAVSECCFKVTKHTQEQMGRIIRENYALLDEMEPGVNLGAFPFGYSTPVNTTK